MKLNELFENLSWATRDNAQQSKMFDNDDYITMNVNIEDVFKHMDPDYAFDTKDETGGTNANAHRLDKAMRHFDANEPMDLPQVAFNPWNKKVEFVNGRHRSMAALKKGQMYIPMFVAKHGLAEFKKLVQTN